MMKSTLYAGIGILVMGAGTAALLAGAGSAPSSSSTPPHSSVTVYGTSSTMVMPSKANIMLGVQSSAGSAQRALGDNNATMQRIVASVEKLGIPKTAITTNGLGINPQYNQSSPPDVVGYQVNDNITIDTAIANTGRVIDAAVAAGANQVNGITFTNPGLSAYNQTYHAALNNARHQAQALAASLGENILGVKSVSVQNSSGEGPVPYFSAAKTAVNTPVYPGQQQESVSLKVVYVLGK